MKIAAVPPYHFYEEGALERPRCRFEVIGCVQGYIQGGVDGDGHIRTDEIVINGRGHAHYRETHLLQRVRVGLRTTTANHDQVFDASALLPMDSQFASLRCLEFRTPCRAENRSSPLNDAADIASAETLEVSFNQARESPIYPQTVMLWESPVRTTARMAAFIPGASPPLVRTARFLIDIFPFGVPFQYRRMQGRSPVIGIPAFPFLLIIFSFGATVTARTQSLATELPRASRGRQHRSTTCQECSMSFVRKTFTGEQARLLARRGTLSPRDDIRPQPWWPEEICGKVERIVWVVYSLGELGDDWHEFTAYDNRGKVLGVHQVEAY